MWLFAIFLTEFSPNPVSPQMEWVELYNDSLNSADISGYIIRDSTTSNHQILSDTIPPQSYFVHSFDDNFLNNTTVDIVKIYDKNNQLIDSQSSKSLPVGLSFSRQTDGTWCPTSPSPNLSNNLCQDSYSLSNSPTPIPYISLKITLLDANSEQIEITNDNNFSVSLFDWRVVDNSGSVRKLSCPTVAANSSCLSSFTLGYLNNNTDKLTLTDPLKRAISIYSYDLKKQPTSKLTPTVKVNSTTATKNISNNQKTISKIDQPRQSTSTVVITKSSFIHNYLSIILMFIGSIFILSPLIFHAKFYKK